MRDTIEQTEKPIETGPELDRFTLGRAKRGDEAACRALFRTYHLRVHAYLFRLLGARASTQQVEDLTQEAFLRAFRALPGFTPKGSARLSTWLITIAHRLALNELRHLKVVRANESQPPVPVSQGVGPAEALERAELGERLRAAMDALSDEQRSVVLLSDLHGLDQAEIGQALDIPVGTVKSRLSRARAALRRTLELEDE